MTVKKEFGNRIKELRQAQNLSQEKFALQIDMDRTYLASIESGKRNVSLENIKKLAEGFEISLAELFKNM
jgi:transcriptional regulator with XRE-family HTH domain